MQNRLATILIGLLVILSTGVLTFWYVITRTVPNKFPTGSSFVVKEDETLRSVSLRLQADQYIHSSLLFRLWVSSLGRDRHLKSGEYSFPQPYVLGSVVKKFVETGPDMPLLSITIPEGSDTDFIAEAVHRALPSISVDAFKQQVHAFGANGVLFPSTYYLLPSYTEESIIKKMKETFIVKFGFLTKDTPLPQALTSQEEVVSLAAILEGEAKTKEDMQMVSGILQTRLLKGMPLQVDAAKETYTTKGLPKIPINNPGSIALYSALNPTPSPYLFYITGKDGKMYYAKTFDEHKKNIQMFLR